MSYDGYGRLQTKHVPEQRDQSNNPTYTSWTYRPDDTIESVTDGRGASATYVYNNYRHLVNEIHYSAPSGITPTSNVTYGYDAVGNRTSMTDGLGSQSYNYDSLSRLSSETRTFSDLGSYTLIYGYNLSGELASITDPFGAQVNYNHDNAGRVASVTGSGFLGISSYASNIQYRAWDAQKSVAYGDGISATATYNARLQPSSYLMTGLREQYQYYADGRLQQMTDLDDRNQDPGYPDTARHFSRVQSYDHVGRITNASGVPGLPYSQSFAYDAFDNTTSRSGNYYYQGYTSDGGPFQNNRRQDFGYDADGNVTHTPIYAYAGGPIAAYRDWTYDAAGQMTQVKETVNSPSSVSTYISAYDGDGQQALEYYQENPTYTTYYSVRSSVLSGQVVTTLDYAGNKSKSTFRIDGQLIAVQNSGAYPALRWTHIDPLGLSEAGDTKPVYDPLGNYIPWQHAPTYPPPNAYPPIAASYGGLGPSFGYAINSSCVLDGIPTDCSLALNNLAHGSAGQCPNNYCGPSRARNGDLVPLTTDPHTGLLGYFSSGSNRPPTLKAVSPQERARRKAIVANFGRSGFGDEDRDPQNPIVIDGHIYEGPETPCHIMAYVAQHEANKALAQNPNDLKAALAQFDKGFATLYVGGPLTSSYQAYRWRGGDGRTINPHEPYIGGDGFRNEYKDSGNDPNPKVAGPLADQTHHFAAYFSLGINNVPAAFIRGMITEDNDGDWNLSRKAYAMGIGLRQNPTTLRNVGLYVKRAICSDP